MRFKKAGGRSIVDLTLLGIGRDVERLREISKATGLNFVCGTGFYVARATPLCEEVRRGACRDHDSGGRGRD